MYGGITCWRLDNIDARSGRTTENEGTEKTKRAVLIPCLLLLAASCRDPQNRSDAGVGTGGSSGPGPSGGTRGTAVGGSSGGSAQGGFGGVTSGGGSGGTGTDALVIPPADGGSEDGSGSVVDVAPDVGSGLEPIHVSEAQVDSSAASYSNLWIVGVGLDQYEGDVVTFRIGSGNGFWRFGSGQVRIAQGAFDVLFTGVLPPIYEPKIVHIDADGSGACEVGEPLFLDSALLQGDTTLTVTPTDVRFRTAASGSCDTVNAPPPY